jgi:hypothetical protein
MKEHGKIPELYIEKLLLDELPPDEKEQLLKDPEVRRRVAELEASNRRILAEYPPEAMAQAIHRRELQSRGGVEAHAGRLEQKQIRKQESPRYQGRRRLEGRRSGGVDRLRTLVPAFGFAVLVLAAAVVLVTRWTAVFAPESPTEEIRLKGSGAHLVLYRNTASGAEILQDGEKVGEGDTLQIGYVAAGQAYGVILSVDGRGTVTVHLPSASSVAQPLDQEGIVLMPFAYQLDDAPEFERFFFVTSKEEFDLAAVLKPARKLADAPERAKTDPLALPEELDQTSLLLLK